MSIVIESLGAVNNVKDRTLFKKKYQDPGRKFRKVIFSTTIYSSCCSVLSAYSVTVGRYEGDLLGLGCFHLLRFDPTP